MFESFIIQICYLLYQIKLYMKSNYLWFREHIQKLKKKKSWQCTTKPMKLVFRVKGLVLTSRHAEEGVLNMVISILLTKFYSLTPLIHRHTCTAPALMNDLQLCLSQPLVGRLESCVLGMWMLSQLGDVKAKVSDTELRTCNHTSEKGLGLMN